jgi:predicted regulator of Ras-like GTPase activity (Roadblock/LC7/MglB family)
LATTGLSSHLIIDEKSDDDALGALASSIAATVRRSMSELGAHELAQVTVEADNQKIFLTDAGIGTLVVTTEPRVNIGLVRLGDSQHNWRARPRITEDNTYVRPEK